LIKEVVLSLSTTSAIRLPAGTVLVALMPGQYVAGSGPQIPGVPLVNRPMASWADYSFSPNLKVMVRDTGQVGFLARDTVIELWHSPFVDGTVAERWCTWQLQAIRSPTFDRDFRAGVLGALTSGTHSIRGLLACCESFLGHVESLRRMTGDQVQLFRTLEDEPMVLFRFYTGEHHGLLPKFLTQRYQAGQRIDLMALLNERRPAPAARGPAPPPSPGRGRGALALGRGASAHARPVPAAALHPFSEDMRPMGQKVVGAAHGPSAHGQGYTQDSPLVSTGPSLPNLIASSSKKLKVILFGKEIFPEGVGRNIKEDRATHLGVFFVPAGMWHCELTGLESQMEREVVYDGFTEAGYEGLWDYEMFTLRNPFSPSSGYGAPYRADLKFFAT
jgi:hypothetical protein